MAEGFPGSSSDKEPTFKYWRYKRHRFSSCLGKIPWQRAWQPTSVFLPRESHGQKSLEIYSSLGHKESDTTEVTYHPYIHIFVYMFTYNSYMLNFGDVESFHVVFDGFTIQKYTTYDLE